MTRSKRARSAPLGPMSGMMAVEFGLVAIIFVFMVVAITDLGRWFFTSNALSEAARLGARLAVVCDRADWTGGVLRRMRLIDAQITSANVTFGSSPSASCVAYGTDPSTVCTAVSVTVSGVTFRPLSPYLPSMNLPPFRVTLTRESMASSLPEQVAGGNSPNPLCS